VANLVMGPDQGDDDGTGTTHMPALVVLEAARDVQLSPLNTSWSRRPCTILVSKKGRWLARLKVRWWKS
jgi:hypothetical protein